VLPYRRGTERAQGLAMRVGGHYEPGEITPQDWLSLARKARLDPSGTIERILSLAARLPDTVARIAAEPAVRVVDAEFADDLVERVSWWVQECVSRLERAG